jgi:DNA modification methylase
VGNFGYTDPLHVKEYHPKGKNPGDVISLSKHTGTSFESIESIKQRIGDAHKGEATANLYRPHKTHHPVGKNPGDVIQMEASLKFPEGAPRWSIPDFWSIPTRPFKGAHFAVYPEEICIRPILSSCPPNGIVLDPMCGSGTTLLVAKKLGRHYIGIDINEEYVKMARERLAAVPEKLEKWLGK